MNRGLRLKKPCIHDRYDRHWPNLFEAVVCPGGEFLPEDALERVAVVLYNSQVVPPSVSWDQLDSERDWWLRRALFVFDALADQVGEPGQERPICPCGVGHYLDQHPSDPVQVGEPG